MEDSPQKYQGSWKGVLGAVVKTYMEQLGISGTTLAALIKERFERYVRENPDMPAEMKQRLLMRPPTVLRQILPRDPAKNPVSWTSLYHFFAAVGFKKIRIRIEAEKDNGQIHAVTLEIGMTKEGES